MPELNNNKINLDKYKKPFLTGLYIVISIVVLFFLIRWFTPKPQMPTEWKAKIDSLTNMNKELQILRDRLDSTKTAVINKVDEVDWKISNIKEKTTLIREYYHDKISNTDKYTPNQLDSFFRNRYNY